jgi:hypothetical protein
MDHIYVMLESDLDDFISSQVRSNWGILTSLANDIGLVGLYYRCLSALSDAFLEFL